ncbi:MAG TPA: endonuclease MutS2 [Candidatus Dormibacteraeota bacterium]|nr:endonuclease MutS2 [Candidatus Dormibacteraeota bacterium]
MHDKSLQVLELPKVLAQVARETGFSVARERVLGLEPTPDLDEARERLAWTREAVHLLERHPRAGVGGAHDIRPQVRRAARDGTLAAAELVPVLATLRAVVAVARLLGALDQHAFPRLRALAAGMPTHPELVRRIEQTVSEEGEVLDTASPRLRRLRGEVRSAHQRLVERARALVGELGPVLQEPIVTTRGERYVLPVKAEFRGRVRGIVHDQSASGATLYVEPLEVVELNNGLRELQSQEREEVERVLREVSGEIGRAADSILAAVEGLGELDLQLAKARYARLTRGREPVLNDQGRVVLDSARHPLLSGQVVPIDVRLDRDAFVIVISGPNTGGKTVALKTVGLLTLMAQTGLYVPAGDGTELAVFEEVFADIGDEQSIEQSLSTFSSHLTRIVEILRGVEAVRRRGKGSALVLLDELGAGTDPDEGSALARSILTYLLDRRVPTVATTHYSELKAFAHEREGAVNASVAFDLETLSPTYRLEIGLPGRSNALAIAERLGLDPRILRGARRHLGTAGVRMEGLLEDLEAERAAVEEERRRLGLALAEVERQRAALEEERRRLQAEREGVLEEVRARARSEVKEALEELAGIRARARLAPSEAEVETLRRRARELAERLAPAPGRVPRVAAPSPHGPPAVGDTVRVRSLGHTGEVLGLSPDGQAEVRLGAFRVRVGLADLERVAAPAAPGPEPAVVRPRLEGRPAVPYQIDVRGRRVEEALLELESRLNDAVLAGMPGLRIVHGKGTGALRAAVRAHLVHHPLVESCEPAPPPEGGDGVTVVRLVG